MEESKILSKAPRYYYWVLGVFIYSFVCLFIFSVNKCLLKIANNFFFYFKSFKKFLTCRSSPSDVFSRRRVFYGCAVNFGSHICAWCDFEKVTKGLCWDHASVLLFPCGFALCLRSIFLRGTIGGLLLIRDNFIYNFQFILLNKQYYWGF